jgi:hypothetical protein
MTQIPRTVYDYLLEEPSSPSLVPPGALSRRAAVMSRDFLHDLALEAVRRANERGEGRGDAPFEEQDFIDAYNAYKNAYNAYKKYRGAGI